MRILKEIIIGNYPLHPNLVIKNEIKDEDLKNYLEGFFKGIVKKSKENTLLFVWGTLMRGMSNHYLLQECVQSFYLGEGKTKQEFLRTSFKSTYEIPENRKQEFEGYRTNTIVGELYLIKRGLLTTDIDALEEYPYVYTRELKDIELKADVVLKIEEDGKEKTEVRNIKLEVKAWMYFFKFEDLF